MITDEQKDILKLYDKGYKRMEIATTLKVNPYDVTYALNARKRMFANNPIYKGLSTRARNVLAAKNIQTKKDAKKSILSNFLRNAADCGTKTKLEIAQWAGLETLSDNKIKTICPQCGHIFNHKNARRIRWINPSV